MVNTPLVEDTMLHIRSYPELHNQSFFYEVNEFGLAACFAGRSLLLAGYEPLLTHIVGAKTCLAVHPYTHERVNPFDEARFLLGIDREWAQNLFSSANTSQMLERKVKDLLNGSPLEKYDDHVLTRP